MREIGEDSKSIPATYRARPRDATFRGGESPPPRSDQGKREKKKKREKNSWRNGGFGAVNPKVSRGVFKTIQPSNLTGKRIKIKEIPFFRDATQWLPAVNKTSLKAAMLPTAKRLLLTPCTVEPTSYETDRGKRVILTPVKAKKASSVQVLLILRLEPESAMVRLGVAQLPPTCSPVIKPVVISSADTHPVSRPQSTPREHPTTPPLITAVLQCDYQALERLLKDRTVNVNAQDADGRTALHHAVRQKDLKATERLLLHPNIDPNVRDKLGNTPFGTLESTYEKLLSHPNLDPNAQDNLGNRLFGALKSTNKGVAKKLTSHIETMLTGLNQPGLLAGRTNQTPRLKQMMGACHSEKENSIIHNPSDLFCFCSENHNIFRNC